MLSFGFTEGYEPEKALKFSPWASSAFFKAPISSKSVSPRLVSSALTLRLHLENHWSLRCIQLDTFNPYQLSSPSPYACSVRPSMLPNSVNRPALQLPKATSIPISTRSPELRLYVSQNHSLPFTPTVLSLTQASVASCHSLLGGPCLARVLSFFPALQPECIFEAKTNPIISWTEPLPWFSAALMKLRLSPYLLSPPSSCHL